MAESLESAGFHGLAAPVRGNGESGPCPNPLLAPPRIVCETRLSPADGGPACCFGLKLSRHDLDEVYRRMIALADRSKSITDDDVIAIAAEVCGQPRVSVVPRDGTATAREVNQEAGYGFGV